MTVKIMKKQKMFKNMGGNIPGGNSPGGNFPGGSLMGGNFPGGSFPDTTLYITSVTMTSLILGSWSRYRRHVTLLSRIFLSLRHSQKL